jgi:hypothetical protein
MVHILEKGQIIVATKPEGEVFVIDAASSRLSLGQDLADTWAVPSPTSP